MKREGGGKPMKGVIGTGKWSKFFKLRFLSKCISEEKRELVRSGMGDGDGHQRCLGRFV